MYSCVASEACAAIRADTGDHSCSAQSGHDRAVRSQIKIQHCSSKGITQRGDTPCRDDEHKTAVGKRAHSCRRVSCRRRYSRRISRPCSRHPCNRRPLHIFSMYSCVASEACAAIRANTGDHSCSAQSGHDRAVRSQIKIQHCSSKGITQHGNTPCRDDEHKTIFRERAHSCRRISSWRRCGRRISRPCSNHPCNRRPLHILSMYSCVASEACAAINADTGDHSCSAQSGHDRAVRSQIKIQHCSSKGITQRGDTPCRDDEHKTAVGKRAHSCRRVSCRRRCSRRISRPCSRHPCNRRPLHILSMYSCVASEACAAIRADTGDHSCSAQSGHDRAVRSQIKIQHCSSKGITQRGDKPCRDDEHERAVRERAHSCRRVSCRRCSRRISRPCSRHPCNRRPLHILSMYSCVASEACAAIRADTGDHSCSAQSGHDWAVSKSETQHCSSRSSTQRGDKPCRDNEHRIMGRERAHSCRRVSCGRRTSRPCSKRPRSRPLHVLSVYSFVALKACATIRADTGDHSCSVQPGHDWAVNKSKYSIAAAGASHSVVTSPAAM